MTGAGSTLTKTETRTYDGSLNIESGANFTSDSAVIVGTVRVSGEDGSGNASSWTTTGYFSIGNDAFGNFEILLGGSVDANSGLSIGGPYEGNVMVSGDGSILRSTGTVTVDNGSLRVEDGGTVSNVFGVIGNGSSSSSVVVTGQNSSWINSSQLTIGNYAGGSLLIEDGASVSSNQGYVGASSVGSVTVTGTGSNWQITDYGLTIGNYGSGTVKIEDSGLIYAKSGVLLGASAASSSGTLTIKGTSTSRGVLETGYVRAGPGTAAVTLDGGIVRAIANNNYFFSDFGNQQIQLGANGGFFDTNSYDIRI